MLVEPSHRNDVLGELSERGTGDSRSSGPLPLEFGTERADVAEETPGLIFGGLEAGEVLESKPVITMFDDPRGVSHVPGTWVAVDVHLLDVEPEFVQPLQSLLYPEGVAENEVCWLGQFGPQPVVAVLDLYRHFPRVDVCGQSLAGFAAQAILLYLPFAMLQRSARAVNVRRNPILLTYAVGVLLFVHIQGLAGLSTLSETSETSETSEPAQVAQLVGYLAIGALLQLVATLSAAEATRSLNNAAENLAADHNAQVDKYRSVEVPPPQ